MRCPAPKHTSLCRSQAGTLQVQYNCPKAINLKAINLRCSIPGLSGGAAPSWEQTTSTHAAGWGKAEHIDPNTREDGLGGLKNRVEGQSLESSRSLLRTKWGQIPPQMQQSGPDCIHALWRRQCTTCTQTMACETCARATDAPHPPLPGSCNTLQGASLS